jgi:hypothetical protein
MKNKNFWLGILPLVIGMTVIGCYNVNNNLPESNGNPVSGWTCYVKKWGKFVFSTTANGDTHGIITVQQAKFGDPEAGEEEGPILKNGKFTYEDVGSGTYTWNKKAGTITLTMEGEDDIYYAYSFSADRKALFLVEALPVNEGTNELSGQTYNGVKSAEKDANQKYVFTDSGYTFTWNPPGYDQETEAGSYAYDNSQKKVLFKPQFKNGKNMAAYYAGIKVSTEHNYVDDYACRAALTHVAFTILPGLYSSKDKLILLIDED